MDDDFARRTFGNGGDRSLSQSNPDDTHTVRACVGRLIVRKISYLFLSCRYSYRCVFVGVGCVVIKLSFSVDDWLAPDLVTVCSARSAQVVVIRRPDAAFSVRTQRRGVLAA